MPQTHVMLDCLIIGGGPAGLTTATYLKRFHRRVMVVDEGHSRANLIPRSHNIPGFPGGISGAHMLRRLRDHARRYEVDVGGDRIVSLLRGGDAFRALGVQGEWHARNIVIATGIIDRTPPLPHLRNAIDAGIARLCPVCDGYEATGRRIAIYASSFDEGWGHATFLRTFSTDVAMVVPDTVGFDETQKRSAVEHGIELVASPRGISFGPRTCMIGDGSNELEADVLYIALGADVQSSLASSLGAETDENGEMVVDEHMQTRVAGLYAVGDVTRGLNQVSVGVGQAAIAATAIHNRLPPNPMRGTSSI